jgi:3'(2'), 5'-bisphosphate nucleotidase
MIPAHSQHMTPLIALALKAGREIMAVYATDFSAKVKADLTPVTEADEAAERTILAGLAEIDPKTPVISEEAATLGRIPDVSRRFYLVDPLDGTKEFLSRNGEFTVNIGLIDLGSPIAGVVYAPAVGRLFWGAIGCGAWQARLEPADDAEAAEWTPAVARMPPARGLTVVASRSHQDKETEAYLKTLRVAEAKCAGSSLKFCLVAAAEADVYPRFGRTMEWDTAAGHAILAAAGGKVVTADGATLLYGKRARGFDNPGFIASGA